MRRQVVNGVRETGMAVWPSGRQRRACFPLHPERHVATPRACLVSAGAGELQLATAAKLSQLGLLYSSFCDTLATSGESNNIIPAAGPSSGSKVPSPHDLFRTAGHISASPTTSALPPALAARPSPRAPHATRFEGGLVIDHFFHRRLKKRISAEACSGQTHSRFRIRTAGRFPAGAICPCSQPRPKTASDLQCNFTTSRRQKPLTRSRPTNFANGFSYVGSSNLGKSRRVTRTSIA